MNVLQIRDFSQHYNNQKNAVDHLNLSLEAGEILGFIGHNGAGKSTTIKSIVGILPVREGEITVLGQNVMEHRRDCQQQCAYIPDNPDLYENMTGIGYINFISDLYGVSGEVRTERIHALTEEFEITTQLGNLIGSYSHGMKQKTAIIAALAHDPQLLVLDEPFVGLDPKATAVLKQQMRNVCSRGGAVFFSTHVLDVAERLCDRVAMIDHGRLVAEGRVQDLTQGRTLEELFLERLAAQGETDE